jgi:hypothetical protein
MPNRAAGVWVTNLSSGIVSSSLASSSELLSCMSGGMNCMDPEDSEDDVSLSHGSTVSCAVSTATVGVDVVNAIQSGDLPMWMWRPFSFLNPFPHTGLEHIKGKILCGLFDADGGTTNALRLLDIVWEAGKKL